MMIIQSTDREDFCLEIDHISIFDINNMAGVTLLQEFGFHCSERVIQRLSQGTISTVFFFENMYLELVYLVDRDMAKDYGFENGINLVNRAYWRQTGASPFGIGLRSKPIFTPQKCSLHNMDVANYTDFPQKI
ncbi:MAG: hypothetical protein HC820_02990 [Hydrococcus sp. RM1_1_31]|nr:hypothetical protein [Hydrococcus sp. RM1_1_31]